MTKNGPVVLFPSVPITGRYFLRANLPDGYRAEGNVRLKPPRKASGAALLLPGEPLTARVASLPGGTMSLTVRAMKGSTAAPTILSILDMAGNELMGQARLRETRASAVLSLGFPLPGGDLWIQVGTRDGTSGAIAWRARIHEPRGYPLSLLTLPSGGQ